MYNFAFLYPIISFHHFIVLHLIYCAEFLRPFLMSFQEMTEEEIVNVNNQFDEDVKKLKPFNLDLRGKKVVIDYHVINSMHDGYEIVCLAKDKLK